MEVVKFKKLSGKFKIGLDVACVKANVRRPHRRQLGELECRFARMHFHYGDC